MSDPGRFVIVPNSPQLISPLEVLRTDVADLIEEYGLDKFASTDGHDEFRPLSLHTEDYPYEGYTIDFDMWIPPHCRAVGREPEEPWATMRSQKHILLNDRFSTTKIVRMRSFSIKAGNIPSFQGEGTVPIVATTLTSLTRRAYSNTNNDVSQSETKQVRAFEIPNASQIHQHLGWMATHIKKVIDGKL